MAETSAHVLLMLSLIATLRQFFADRKDVYVIGNIFLYWEEGNPRVRNSPDVMVVKGADRDRVRLNFKVWEEGAAPCVVFELTSRGTADEDQGPKKEVYQQLGVKEYFLFDPFGEYLPRQLIGYILINGIYEPLQHSADGGLTSNELMLRLRAEGTDLILTDYRTGERIPTPSETHRLWLEARDQVLHERERAEEAEHHATELEQQRRAEEERARQAEERRLREEERALRADERARRSDERALQANERAMRSDERARDADERSLRSDERARDADERRLREEERARSANERAQAAEEHARLLAEELKRLRGSIPPPETGNPPPAP
jgi:Uma2 family endonuclease